MAISQGATRRATAAALPGAPVGSLRFDWASILLGSWFAAGLQLDGWAHTHIPQLETFFTPWHGALYSGYAAYALFLAASAVRFHTRGHAWPRALPVGYMPSLVGAAIFGVGGVLDLIWHTIFGIERSIDALLSPTHLMLATGLLLMISGPLRAAWVRGPAGARVPWRAIAPALLSLAYVFFLLTFFTQYANPITHSYADKPPLGLTRDLGVTSILLQTGIQMGIVLLAVRRWRLPLGAFALIFALNFASSAILADQSPVLSVAILGALVGLAVDLLNRALDPTSGPVPRFRLFAFAVPFVNYVVYFIALLAINGIAWTVHLWVGSIVIAGATGLLLSYLLVPPSAVAASSAAPAARP